MRAALVQLALLLAACGSVPCPAPVIADAGEVPHGGSAYTQCSSGLEGQRRCSDDELLIVCGRFKYNGTVYFVWTTDGAACP